MDVELTPNAGVFGYTLANRVQIAHRLNQNRVNLRPVGMVC